MKDPAPKAPLQARALRFHGAGASAPDGFSASFAPGLALLVDVEGVAKTGLLPLLAGERAPFAGTVQWRGRDLAALPAVERAALIFWRDPRAHWPEVTPARWVQALATRYPTWRSVDWRAHVLRLGLKEHLDKDMFRLSTGSKRKVLLAAALACGAPLTLIDEPEAGLDRPSIDYLRAALSNEAACCRSSGRVFVVTNYESTADVPWAQVLPLG